MIREQLPYLLTGLGGVLTGVAALLGVQRSRRAGVAGDEREARRDEAQHRRDTLADRDSLIDRLVRQVELLTGQAKDLTDRVEALEEKRREDAVKLRDAGDHIDTLEHHIWRQLPPPPPARPAGL